jgi:SAM-dependent methyltransferase
MALVSPRLTADACAVDLAQLLHLQQPPEPFAPGTGVFWTDPYISEHVLAAHLDPATPAASRMASEIDRAVDWLVEHLKLGAGAELLDLGCGPGLYAARLAARGLRVTGVDFSRRSIDYAEAAAHREHLEIAYRCQDYLTLDEHQRYDVALLIYGDYCVLAPAQRTRLLQNVHRALRPHGRFVLDVSTRVHRARQTRSNQWYAASAGFWRPGPHLVLEQGFDYPAAAIYLDQYIVVEPGSALSVYRNWYQDYTADSISAELTAHCFAVRSLWDDLAGASLSESGEWIAVVAEKA